MKICFFNRSYWPDQAATGQLLTELAEDLVSRYGHEVTVVAGRAAECVARGDRIAPGPARDAARCTTGVDIRRANGTRLRPGRFVARASNYVSYFAAATAASFGVDRPDVVVSLTDPPIVGLAARCGPRGAPARASCFSARTSFPKSRRCSRISRTARSTRRSIASTAICSGTPTAIVALGDRMRRRLVEEKGADPARVHVIHNWADCDAIVPGPKDNAFARAHGLVDRFVLMHSGNVGLSQNLEVLDRGRRPAAVEGAADDRDRRRRIEAPRARGDGGGARARPTSRFFPYQPKALLHESFASADAFRRVAQEPASKASSCRARCTGSWPPARPYIAATDPSSGAGGRSRADGGCGLVAAPGDPAALADAIVALHDDPAATREMGERARRVARQFDRRSAVQAYHELFERVAGIERAA